MEMPRVPKNYATVPKIAFFEQKNAVLNSSIYVKMVLDCQEEPKLHKKKHGYGKLINKDKQL